MEISDFTWNQFCSSLSEIHLKTYFFQLIFLPKGRWVEKEIRLYNVNVFAILVSFSGFKFWFFVNFCSEKFQKYFWTWNHKNWFHVNICVVDIFLISTLRFYSLECIFNLTHACKAKMCLRGGKLFKELQTNSWNM